MADVPRPTHLVVVAGTGTDIGKTWVAATLLTAWRDGGWAVAARKPAQSFDPTDPRAQLADMLLPSGASLQVSPGPPRTREVAARRTARAPVGPSAGEGTAVLPAYRRRRYAGRR